MFGCLWCPLAHPSGIGMACRANLWSKLYIPIQNWKFLLIGTLLAVTVGTLVSESHVIPNHLSFQITFYYKSVFPNLWVQLVIDHSVQRFGKLVQTFILCSKGSKGEKWENGARSLAIASCYYSRTPMMVRAGDKQIPSSPPAIAPAAWWVGTDWVGADNK